VFNIGKYGVLESDSCIEVEEKQKLHILAFSAKLAENMDLNIILDVNNDIEETNEGNNFLNTSVYSGDAYKLDENTTCTSTCYDSDGGYLYPAPFEVSKVFVKGDYYVNYKLDFCEWNNLELHEYFCDNKSDYVDLAGLDVPCYVIGKKCAEGLEDGVSHKEVYGY